MFDGSGKMKYYFSIPMIEKGRLPSGMRKKVPLGVELYLVKKRLRSYGLNTVCEEARCPNIGECFSKSRATFMILGKRCTRNCAFCCVENGPTDPPDPSEPERISYCVTALGLKHVVITSVTRDDLPDKGAGQFIKTIREIRKRNGRIVIEILTPDFGGIQSLIEELCMEDFDIFNHNVETVPRLYSIVRPQAKFERSLMVLELVKRIKPGILTKSGLMVGLGERFEEIVDVMDALRGVGCDIITIGQYLQPSKDKLEVREYVPMDRFVELEKIAIMKGFSYVASAPFVRSSFNAEEMVKDYRMEV